MVHIDGDNNVWADMLSRWGAAGSSAVTDEKRSQDVQVAERQDRILTAEAHTGSSCADSENQVRGDEERWPSLDEIRAAQDLVDEVTVVENNLVRDDGLLMDEAGHTILYQRSHRICGRVCKSSLTRE